MSRSTKTTLIPKQMCASGPSPFGMKQSCSMSRTHTRMLSFSCATRSKRLCWNPNWTSTRPRLETTVIRAKKSGVMHCSTKESKRLNQVLNLDCESIFHTRMSNGLSHGDMSGTTTSRRILKSLSS